MQCTKRRKQCLRLSCTCRCLSYNFGTFSNIACKISLSLLFRRCRFHHGNVRSISREGNMSHHAMIELPSSCEQVCRNSPGNKRYISFCNHSFYTVDSQVSEVGAPGHFKATNNDRINLMYKEAAEFARRLDKCSRQIKAVETATAGSFW